MEWLALGGALLLVLLNGFFVMFEYSMVKVRPTQLETLAAQGRMGAFAAISIRKNLDRWLSASQTGVTLASLALGWIGEPAFTALVLPQLLKVLPDSEATQGIAHTVSLVLAFGIITFLHIILGEQVPKLVAI